MKIPRPRFRKAVRRIASVSLCCLMIIGCLTLPALGTDGSQSDLDTEGSAPEPDLSSTPE